MQLLIQNIIFLSTKQNCKIAVVKVNLFNLNESVGFFLIHLEYDKVLSNQMSYFEKSWCLYGYLEKKLHHSSTFWTSGLNPQSEWPNPWKTRHFPENPGISQNVSKETYFDKYEKRNKIDLRNGSLEKKWLFFYHYPIVIFKGSSLTERIVRRIVGVVVKSLDDQREGALQRKIAFLNKVSGFFCFVSCFFSFFFRKIHRISIIPYTTWDSTTYYAGK